MLKRYRRQISIPGWGEAGQEKLARSKVMVIGAGGLGFPVLSYLAAAGVGEIVIVEQDWIEETNLNRQLFFSTGDLGKPKIEVAVEKLTTLNPQVRLSPVAEKLSSAVGNKYLPAMDAVIDCVDNFETRLLIASLAHRYQKPMIHGSLAGFLGVVAVLHSSFGPCFHCLYPEAPEISPPAVFGAQAGLVGSLQAVETIKYLLGIGETNFGKMLLIDTESGFFNWIDITKNNLCPNCLQMDTTPDSIDRPIDP